MMTAVPRAWPAPLALVPRERARRCTREEACALLDGERSFSVALALRAIAEGWDTGRISVTGVVAAGAVPLHERTVLGLIGISQGLATARVAETTEALSDVSATSRKLAEALAGLVTPLDEIVGELSLSPLERMVLIVIAAPQLWGEVAQLYAIAANGDHRAIVDEHLVRQLIGPRVDVHELAAALDPDGPLVRFGLVHATTPTPRPFAGLVVDPLVLARLRGDPLDRDPERALAVVGRVLPLAELRLSPEVDRELRIAIARRPDSPLRLVVRGRPGSGRRTLLAALAQSADRQLAMIDVAQLGSGELPTAADLRRALERCGLAGWIPCIDGLDALDTEAHRALTGRLQHVIAEFPAPMLMRLAPEGKAPLDPGYVQIDLIDLSETERLELWTRALVGLDTKQIAPLVARWRIGPGTIHRVIDGLAAAGSAITPDAIERAIAQYLEQRIGDVAERVRDLPRLDDMVLPPDIVDSLIEFLSRARFHRRVFEEWGMAKVATTGRGITALFEGPPGTGKTMVAGAIARELGIDLYRVDLSRIMSKWIGETERNLATVFSAAEEGHAIILFDEADSLFTKRTEVKSSNDRFANLEVNYLLQRLDSFVGIAILTTNFGTSIDAAFKRRLSFRVQFPIPDEELRTKLWRAHLPPELPLANDLDLEMLAHKYHLTGGAVRNCVLRAAFLAASENRQLGQDHLLRAIRLEYRSVGKLTEGGALE